MNQVETLIRLALQERGVPVSTEEIEALVAAYPAFKARVEGLYAVTEARYELPAVSFASQTSGVEW
jgi:hypothetical protein